MRNSPGLLVLAFLLGTSLWVFVTDTENPTVVDIFSSSIAVQAVNVGESLAVANQLGEVDIRVSAPRDRWDRLTSANFRAFVDLKGLEAREQQVRVQVEVENVVGVRVTEVLPRTITVNLEDFVSVEVPVTVRLVGTLPIGYELGGSVPQLESVVVAGPQSLIDIVREAVADVNITGLTVDVDPNVPLTARGAGGGEIRGVTITPSSVRVNVQILQRTLFRTLPLTVRIIGEPANGYRVSNVTISPPAIEVQGSIRALQQLDALALPSVDVTGHSAGLSIPLRIPLPDGVSASTDVSATVTVSIVPASGSLRLTVAPELTNVADGLTASVDTTSIVVVVEGPIPVLDALAVADVRVLIDLTGRPAGVYDEVPQIEIPDGLTVVIVTPQTVSVTLSP
ncbi:MAG: CdaR family protein [Chloroflexi bacterium]|nr:CdaR family protein [Chloroflexota bacterium]